MTTSEIPATHVLPIAGGWRMVFWIDTTTGHLRNGAILRQTGDELVVCYTRGQSFTVLVSELVPVPRFFRGGEVDE